MKEIVELMLTEVNQTINKKGITLEVTEPVKEELIELGYDKAMGVRPLRRVIEQEIRDRITDYYLEHPDDKHLKANLADGQIVISKQDK